MIEEIATVKVGNEERIVLHPKLSVGVDEMFRGALQLDNLIKENLIVDFDGNLVEINKKDSIDDLIEKFHK